MFDYETALEQLAHRTVLCVGDLMLDDFVYGEVSRVSPEAPVPVIAVRREEKVIGGAGNVARNLAGLGARCLFGADEAADLVTRTIASFADAIEPHLKWQSRCPARCSLKLTRSGLQSAMPMSYVRK
jgi:D-beta-D-heptose 7-phosphate kinase/D-beta-D-heptose 1-phosphate adenosyltransferase